MTTGPVNRQSDLIHFLGANTTTASIVHAVLDFLHDRPLMEKIQREIDDSFAPEDKITHVEV